MLIPSWRRVALAGAMAFAAIPISGSLAFGQTLGPLVKITFGDPFANCTADNVGGQPGSVFPGTAIEPQLAINPVSPSAFLVGVQQDRWTNGGARGTVNESSTDGGATWKLSMTPNVTLCQRGPWQRASDPWVAFSSDGARSYMSSLVVDESSNPNVLAALSGQVVSTSTDGGVTWSAPSTLIIDSNPNVLNDKNSVTADAANPKIAYVVWDRLQQFVAGAAGGEGAAATTPNLIPPGTPHEGMAIAHAMMEYGRKIRSGQAAPIQFPLLVKGPTLFSRTLDGGAHWSTPKVIFDPGKNAQTIANVVVTLPNGFIADFFTDLDDNTAGQPARIGLVVSADKGGTWSQPNFAQQIVNQTAVTPNLQQPIRSASVLFSVAVDRAHNLTYLVWEDQRFSGVNEVAFAISPNDGFEWTAPIRINQTPRNPLNPLFQQALIPTVAVAADGTVGVTYYDFRNDVPGATTDATDYFAIFCNPLTSADACTSNGDWSHEQRLTNNSFDMNSAPVAEGHFLGDYMALRTSGRMFGVVFGQAPKPNITHIYFRSVTLPTVTASGR